MQQDKSAHYIPGLPHCLIDGFKHSLEHIVDFNQRIYFLTHFHSDHYTGLFQGWKAGHIYCSTTTARLLINVHKVRNTHLIHPVEIGDTIAIPGAKVTFLDANHCPGAALLLFQLDNGLVHLHTGDMRYHPRMKTYEALQTVKIDKVFLDTTYAHPKHQFRPQADAIQDIIRQARDFLFLHGDQGLVYLSAYNLGKERVIFAVQDALNRRPIYMDMDKIRIMQQIEGGAERVASGLFTSDPLKANIHICGMGFAGHVGQYFRANFDNLAHHTQLLNDEKLARQQAYESEGGVESDEGLQLRPFSHVLAFIPTGWAESSSYNKSHSFQAQDNIAVQLIPYSEHSQYQELMEFVEFLKPREVVPTVFADDRNRVFIVHLFRNLVDKKQNMQNFIDKFTRNKTAHASTKQQLREPLQRPQADEVLILDDDEVDGANRMELAETDVGSPYHAFASPLAESRNVPTSSAFQRPDLKMSSFEIPARQMPVGPALASMPAGLSRSGSQTGMMNLLARVRLMNSCSVDDGQGNMSSSSIGDINVTLPAPIIVSNLHMDADMPIPDRAPTCRTSRHRPVPKTPASHNSMASAFTPLLGMAPIVTQSMSSVAEDKPRLLRKKRTAVDIVSAFRSSDVSLACDADDHDDSSSHSSRDSLHSSSSSGEAATRVRSTSSCGEEKRPRFDAAVHLGQRQAEIVTLLQEDEEVSDDTDVRSNYPSTEACGLETQGSLIVGPSLVIPSDKKRKMIDDRVSPVEAAYRGLLLASPKNSTAQAPKDHAIGTSIGKKALKQTSLTTLLQKKSPTVGGRNDPWTCHQCTFINNNNSLSTSSGGDGYLGSRSSDTGTTTSATTNSSSMSLSHASLNAHNICAMCGSPRRSLATNDAVSPVRKPTSSMSIDDYGDDEGVSLRAAHRDTVINLVD